MPTMIDLTGQQFERLTVIRRTGRRPRSWWMCQCRCGNMKEYSSDALRSGHSQSCGCLAYETRKSCRFKHGHSRVGEARNPSTEYYTWRCMKSRCYNPRTKKYKYYGGKGIRICERWMNEDGFNNFLNDMGPKPPGHTIERKENRGDYTPGNCRWATRWDQARNTSQVKMIEFNGKNQCVKDWATDLGFKVECLYYRIKAKWSIKDTLSLPPLRNRKK